MFAYLPVPYIYDRMIRNLETREHSGDPVLLTVLYTLKHIQHIHTYAYGERNDKTTIISVVSFFFAEAGRIWRG